MFKLFFSYLLFIREYYILFFQYTVYKLPGRRVRIYVHIYIIMTRYTTFFKKIISPPLSLVLLFHSSVWYHIYKRLFGIKKSSSSSHKSSAISSSTAADDVVLLLDACFPWVFLYLYHHGDFYPSLYSLFS